MAKVKHAVWFAASLIALSAGIYFRVIGFYEWPLAADEYYIYRSMTFILDTGLPQFPCGGYYARGLLYQYLTVPLLHFGASPEAALRSVAILSGLSMLPAAYYLARRIGGFPIAAAVLVILSLSAWEIEMSRFGRMYAPFQALFMWYVYHAYRLITERDIGRWRWLITLSIIGPFVWEGAIVLAIFNFFPILLDRKLASTRYILGAGTVLASSALFLSTNFRFLNSERPPTIETATDQSSAGHLDNFLGSLIPTLINSPIWMTVFALLLCVLVVLVWRAILRADLTMLEILVLVVANIVLAANQLLLTAILITGAALAGWIRPEVAKYQEVRHVILAMFLISLFFVLTAAFGDIAPSLTSRMQILIAFPDILNSIAYPWILSTPLMTVGLVFLALIAMLACFSDNSSKGSGLRLLLAYALAAVTIIGAIPTSYNETRYTFFLYPLLVCIAGYAVYVISEKLASWRPEIIWIPPIMFVALFLVSSDFAYSHLTTISSYETNFRMGYSKRLTRHYYPRADFRSPAEYVNENSKAEDTVIVSSVSFTEYLNDTDYVYLDESETRYRNQACPNTRRERWSDLPLLGTTSELASIDAGTGTRPTWFVIDQQTSQTEEWAKFQKQQTSMQPAYRSPDNRTVVFKQSIDGL